jgi:hypothetical protein
MIIAVFRDVGALGLANIPTHQDGKMNRHFANSVPIWCFSGYLP